MAKTKNQQSLFDFDSMSDFIQTSIYIESDKEPLPQQVQMQEKTEKKTQENSSDIEELQGVLLKIKAVKKNENDNLIVDVGEKIGGARKDFAKKGLSIADFVGMNIVEKVKNVKRDNIWKRDKPEAIMDEGCNPYVYQYANEIRKAITQNPYTIDKKASEEKIKAYIDFVTFIKETLEKTYYAETLGEAQDYLKEQMTGIYFKKVKDRNGRTAYVLTEKAQEIKSFTTINEYYETKTKMFDLIFNPHIFNHAGEFNKEWDEILGKKVNEEIKEDVEKDTNIKTLIKQAYYLTHVVREGGEEYRKDKKEELTAEDFMNTFGFRGVEFGNWLRQTKDLNERQEVLNYAFDAFKDFAKAIGIPDQAIGMNGILAIAFGSRGSGGKNAAAAHYEPGRMVINMTKINGAGSLAHEWFHFADNLYGTKMMGRNQNCSLKYASNEYMLNNDNENTKRLDADQPKVHAAIRAFETTKLSLLYNGARHYIAQGLNETLYGKIQRANELGRKSKKAKSKWSKDRSESRRIEALTDIGGMTHYFASGLASDHGKKEYWGQPIELMARAFEVYTIDKLNDLGIRSDYLVSNIKGDEEFLKKIRFKFGGEDKEGISNTYPAGSERLIFRQYFDSLMESIKMSDMFKIEKPTDEMTEIKTITIGDEKITLFRDNTKFEETMKYEAVHQNMKTGGKRTLNTIKNTLEIVDNQYHLEISNMMERYRNKKEQENKQKESEPNPPKPKSYR